MHIELQYISDPELIKKTVAVDDIYKSLIAEQDLDQWEPDMLNMAYFLTYKDGLPYGVAAVEKFCSNGLIFHGGVFKIMRKKHTSDTIREIIKEVKNLYPEKAIMTIIPIVNELAIHLVKRAGFVEKCILNNASLKGDVMMLVV